jgi:hypothetical protein
MKLSTELIKEIYNAVDENLKAKIEIEVPEIKPTLVVGKWYKHNAGGYLFIEEIVEKIKCYGFKGNMDWFSKDFYTYYVSEFLTLATPEEVKTSLINEAKKIGFMFGKYFKELQDEENGGLIEKSGRCGKWFEFKDNKLFVIGYGRWKIFDNGTWATIITEPTQKELLQKQVDELKRQIDLL